MKGKISYEVGRVVFSRQGHDKGRWFVVVGTVDERYVLIADGKSRRLENPKKKQTKHLRFKPVLLEGIQSAIEQGKPLMNSDIRKAIQAVADKYEIGQNAGRPSGQKEECVLVQK